MKLLTKEILKKLPKLGAQDGLKGEAVINVKFFTPDSSWTWYVLEGKQLPDGDFEFYGIVQGFEREYGDFVLSELQAIRGKLGLPIERDLYFGKPKVKDVFPDLW